MHEERSTLEPESGCFWRAKSAEIPDREPRRRVLLTGATGFLGGAFLAHTRERSGRPIEWVLPARGADLADARRRVHKRLARFVEEHHAVEILANAQIVCADLTDADAFSDAELDGVTHVVHLAANTSFIARAGVWTMNYEATRWLARRLCRVPTLRRFVYVGTAMICGDTAAETVHEECYPSAGAEHLVAYTASKAAAEQMLRNEFPELPLLVARPSVVIGHTRLGCAPSGSIFWVLRALERVRLLAGNTDASLDVVPADYVAEALDHLTFARALKHTTYHISAGYESRTPIRQTAARLAARRSLPVPWPDYEVISSRDVPLYKQRMVQAFGAANGRRMQLALGLYLRFCELNVKFDNSRLRAEGLRQPPPLLEYLETCLRQCEDIDIVEQADDEI
ncbi:MAG: hypothetical protein RLZZ450_2428 [Pseudomonadota bacterium]|jgi:nucleoside-diphosphate-sugar epimerase